MKILMINNYGFIAGGAEKYMFELKNYLEKKGFEVIILASNAYLNKLNESTIKCIIKKPKTLFRQIFNIDAYIKTKKVIEEFKPDIVHLHNICGIVTPSALINLKNIPTIMTVHDYYITCPRFTRFTLNGKICFEPFGKKCFGCYSRIKIYYEKIVFHKLLKNVDFFIAPSTFMSKMLDISGFNPITKLNNAIDLSRYNYIEKHEMEKVILFLGRIVKEKGGEYLLKAMPLVLKKIPDAKLLIAGDGPEKNNLIELAKKLKIDRNVELLGRVPDDALLELYQKASVVVVPSIWPENSPVVIYESMATGRPCIGSNVGGIPELVVDGKTGFLVEPRNPNQIAEKVIQILSDEQLARRMGRNAREGAESEFNMKDHVEKIIKVYESLL